MSFRQVSIVLGFCVLGVYLFVTAPPPLPTSDTGNRSIAIKYVLEIMNEENKIARSIYTRGIVKPGKRVGLKFDEDWQEDDVNAGPLPAQFLRQTAIHLEKSKVPLGLYLGSDFPINKANQFAGVQARYFAEVKRSQNPKFFYVEDIQRYTYMFADIAISDICVKCHNNHKDTGKKDWKLNEVMGATTWTFPDEFISYETAINMLTALRAGFKFAYKSYLDGASRFDNPPKIGTIWPRDGYYLPSVSSFMQEIAKRASPLTLSVLTRKDILKKS